MKKSIRIALYSAIAISLIAIAVANKGEEAKNSKPTVCVTTFALYDIVKHVSDDTLNIVSILPFGVDPHSYEPTPRLVADIEKSALVIYSGAGLEPWTHGFEFKNRALDVSERVTLRELGSEEVGESAHHHDDDEAHGAFDPHYWLSFSNMAKAANLIAKELIAVSPQNEKKYIKNRDAYLAMLKNLDAEFSTKLSMCERDTILVNHNAFGYLSDAYGFHVESLSGLSPEAEPNAKSVIRLIEIIQERNVSTVFFESFASDRAIKSVARETNAKVEVLQPLGNVTADEAKLTYETMMKENLLKLSEALDCR
jgi:zinc transport system substrate-binding protein